MTNIKTILLIGRSGRGKSTLANVITSTNNFKESSGSVSETKKVQFEQFEDTDNKTNYAIIDTPGIGDTKMSDNEVLNIIAEAVYLARDGISQVFFVNDGRFDQYEMATYDLLRTIIFDREITKHTTIVRTRFPEFRDEDEWQADIDLMSEEAKRRKSELEQNISIKEKELANLPSDSVKYQKLSAELEKAKKELTATNLAEIIESCQGRIVYVDNPSLEVENANKLEINKEKREDSREILLEHLKENCQRESYKPDKLKELSDEIVGYMESKLKLEKELEGLRAEKAQQVSSQPSKTKSNKNRIEKNLTEDNKTELVVEKKEFSVEEDKGDLEIVGVKEAIARLQDQKEKLLKEIAEKEKSIRQRVLKHIFNNYKEINQELGGDIFLSSVAGDNDWTEIHSDFTNKELVVKWLSQGLDYQQVKEWSIALGDEFKPEIDADFCVWLRDVKKLTVDKVKRRSHPCSSVEKLREEYFQQLAKENEILSEHAKQLSKDWKEIHPDFTPELQEEWEDYDFNYEQTQEWIQAGFKPDDYYTVYEWKSQEFNPQQAKEWIDKGLKSEDSEFVYYLQKDNYQPADLNENNLEELRKKVSWQDIHEDFSYSRRKNWEEKDFDYQQTKEWIAVGLTAEEAEIATYAKLKGYQTSATNGEELRKEYNTWLKNPPAQEYLDIFYPKAQRKEITDLNISDEELTGSLDLSDFVNLKELRCNDNNLTSLNLSSCSRLKNVRCWRNQLTNLDVSNCSSLEEFHCSSNQLIDLILPKDSSNLKILWLGDSSSGNSFPEQDLVFLSGTVNLEKLYLKNNKFYGSLEPLKGMGKLRELYINDTDLNSGLEYLPDSLECFECSADLKKDAKCKTIADLLENIEGEDFPQKLQAYKQKLQEQSQQQPQILQPTNLPPKK